MKTLEQFHSFCTFEKSINTTDARDAKRFLFSIIYVSKSIVFLCFRS